MSNFIRQMLLVGGLSSLISCQKFSNRINSSVLACGEAADQTTILIPVLGPSAAVPAESIEAFFLEENAADKPVAVSSKGCIRIQRDETRRLLVRTNSGLNLGAIYIPTSQQKIIELQDVSDQNPFLECPRDIFANQNVLGLKSFVKGRYTVEAIRLESQISGDSAFAVAAPDLIQGWLTSPTVVFMN
jgi:hypothetical protein